MFVDVVDTRIEQRLVDQRIGAFSSSGAAHAGVEESLVCTVVLAVVYLRALALGAYVLYSLLCSSYVQTWYGDFVDLFIYLDD